MEVSKWFIIALVITFLASIIAIWVRAEDREEIERFNGADDLSAGDLSADDFEIIE